MGRAETTPAAASAGQLEFASMDLNRNIRVAGIGQAGAAVTMQNAAVASGNGTTLAVTTNSAAYNQALVNVNCSVSCSGGTLINFEGTDSTGTYFSIPAFPLAGGPPQTTTYTSGQFVVPLSGLTTIRARISGYSAGTITVTGTPYNGTVPQVGVLGSVYGNQANFASGVSGNVANTSQTTIIAAPTYGKLYVTALQCFNSGAASSTITLNDGSSWVGYNPTGTGVVVTFMTPLVVAATTALKFTPGSSSTNQFCAAQGYNAP